MHLRVAEEIETVTLAVVRRLFAGTEAVESASSAMIQVMRAVLIQPQVDVIGAIRDCIPLLKDYFEFCANKSRSKQTYKKCNKNSEIFRKFVRKTSATLNPRHSLGAAVLDAAV